MDPGPLPARARLTLQRTTYVLYFAANLAPRALMFVLMLVLTHLMPIAEYGSFVLVVTTGEILDMGLGNWVRILALRSEGKCPLVRPRRLGRLIALTVAMTAAALLLACLATIGRGGAGPFTLGVAAYLLAFAPHRLGLTLLQIQRKHTAYAAVEALRAGGTLAAATGAAVLIGPQFLPVALGLAGATLLSGTLGLLIALHGVERPRRARRGYLACLMYGLPIILSSALGYSLGWLDRYVVDVLIGPHGVAVFAAIYALARQPIELFLAPVNNYAFPHLISTYERDGSAAASRVQAGLLATQVMIGIAITAGLSFLTVPLLAVALPMDYRAEGASMVPWMAVGTLVLAIKLYVFDNAFHVSKRTWLQPPCMLPAAILNVTLIMLLIPRYGMAGAGIGYCVAAVLSLLTTMMVTRRVLPVPMPWRALGRLVGANLCAAAALLAARALLSPLGNLPVLIGCALTYTAVYAGLLTLLGVSIRASLETPWLLHAGPAGRRPWLRTAGTEAVR